MAVVCTGFAVRFAITQAMGHTRTSRRQSGSPRRIQYLPDLPRQVRKGIRLADVLSAQVVDTASRALQGFQYLEIDRNFRLLRRIDARVAESNAGGMWTLRDGRERRFDGDLQAVPFTEKTYGFRDTIQGFLDGETSPEEMTYEKLSGYIRDSKAKGYDVRRYEVDLHAKLSYPLLNIIVALIAIPLALRTPRSGGVWRSIGAGLLVGFFCWMALSASLSLGRRGMLPPLVAAWLPDALFAFAGALLFRRRHA